MLCSPVKVNQRFERTHHIHLQDRKESQARNQHEADKTAALLPAGFLLGLHLGMKMEVIYCSEAPVRFHLIMRRYIP
jgi:hypothetical protein